MSWTVTADPIMPAGSRTAPAWPAVATPTPGGSRTGRLAPTRPPGARIAGPGQWPLDPGRAPDDALPRICALGAVAGCRTRCMAMHLAIASPNGRSLGGGLYAQRSAP